MLRSTLKTLSLAAVALACSAQAPSAEEKKTIRVTVQMPESNHITQNLRMFEKEVEAASNGSLDVEIYPAAQLFKDKEVPRAVGTGQIEMGAAVLTRYSGSIPAVDLFYVPFAFPNAEMVMKAVAPESPIRGPIDNAILKTGARVLWWQPFGNTDILTNDWDARDPSSLKGKKVRVFSAMLGTAVEVLGGDPVVISGSEQVLAYERKVVDVGMAGISSVISRKIFEVMNTVTMTDHAVIEFVVVMNEPFYQSLSEAERKIIHDAARKAEAQLREDYAKIDTEALAKARKLMKVVELSDENVKAWRKAMKPVVDKYLAQSGDLGKQLVDALPQL